MKSDYMLEFGDHGVSYRRSVLVLSMSGCGKLLRHLQQKEAAFRQLQRRHAALLKELRKAERPNPR
jgi:hypothetical protein